MMHEQFINWNPRLKSLLLLQSCATIINELSAYRLTLRQLYYQLVSRNIIPNEERAYKNLSSLVTKARLSGDLDWAAIEDRVRVPKKPTEFQNVGDLLEAALYSYRLPRWKGQSTYCELWVEKDALASVLTPLAKQWHVTLMVNRGYSSASAMYDASKRFIRANDNPDQYDHSVLFYLGDLDPSGEDMVRDIEDRLYQFGADVRVEKIALNMEQVEQYNPPPNPAKLTDPRAADFIARFGGSSWEVDALPPAVLDEIITGAIAGVCDVPMMEEVKRQEEEDAVALRAAVSSYLKGREQ